MPEHASPTVVASDADWDLMVELAIAGKGLQLVFQPIVDLRRGAVAGYETLVRFDGPVRAGPDRWFAEAARRGRQSELDHAVVERALALRASLPRNTFLTINIEPESLHDRRVLQLLCDHDLRGVAIEVTEHRALDELGPVRAALDRLRTAGALLAVDDAGAGYAGLQQILAMRPQILKVDRSLVEGIDTDEAKAALLEMLGVFAGRIDAWVLAEGVETRGEALRCASLGVPLAQGWFFARPAPPWSDIDPAAAAALEEARDPDLRDGLRPLLTVAAWASEDDARRALRTGDAELVVVLDGDRRPLGILDADAALGGALRNPLRANVATTPTELAHRLATVGADLNLPVIVTDNAGRYVGTVRPTRLLDLLARR